MGINLICNGYDGDEENTRIGEEIKILGNGKNSRLNSLWNLKYDSRLDMFILSCKNFNNELKETRKYLLEYKKFKNFYEKIKTGKCDSINFSIIGAYYLHRYDEENKKLLTLRKGCVNGELYTNGGSTLYISNFYMEPNKEKIILYGGWSGIEEFYKVISMLEAEMMKNHGNNHNKLEHRIDGSRFLLNRFNDPFDGFPSYLMDI